MVNDEKEMSRARAFYGNDENFNYYLAGIFDGEGSFLVNVFKNPSGRFTTQLRFKISNNSKKSLIYIKEKLGFGTVLTRPPRENRKELFEFWVNDFKEIKRIIKMIEGKVLVKEKEFEFFKEIADIVEHKRENRGGKGVSSFTREEILKILELRDEIHKLRKGDKKYRSKEWYISNYPEFFKTEGVGSLEKTQ